MLGGHFLRQDTRIEFPDPVLGALQFVSFTGWDRERRAYKSLEVSNMGAVVVNEVHFVASGAMVTVAHGVEAGEPTIDRWVTRFEGDTIVFVGHRAVGDGDFYVHVEGKGKRVATEAKPVLLEDVAFAATAATEMERLVRMVGRYDVKGSMTPAPGAPVMHFTGVDQCRMQFGGTVFATHTVGQPGDYEAFGYLAWDPAIGSYRSIGVSNVGEIHQAECRWVGNDLVYTTAGLRFGQPMVGRHVLETGPDGAIMSVVADGIASADAPARVFEATYTKK